MKWFREQLHYIWLWVESHSAMLSFMSGGQCSRPRPEDNCQSGGQTISLHALLSFCPGLAPPIHDNYNLGPPLVPSWLTKCCQGSLPPSPCHRVSRTGGLEQEHPEVPVTMMTVRKPDWHRVPVRDRVPVLLTASGPQPPSPRSRPRGTWEAPWLLFLVVHLKAAQADLEVRAWVLL